MSEYPREPGAYAHATGGTSQAAARLNHAPLLAVVRDELANAPATNEELAERIAQRLGRRVLLNSVRARTCQLHRSGAAIDTGERGIGESGVAKVVRWALAPQELRRVLAEREIAQ